MEILEPAAPQMTKTHQNASQEPPSQKEASALRDLWLNENAAAFAAQATWHEKRGHPLADIISGPLAPQ
jgi:post-segregation antitoxin (ccd killing protein)